MGAVLPADVVAAAVKEEVGEFRQRLYPPLTALGLFIGQALSPDGACQDAVARNLSDRRARGESGCSLSTGPYCKARQRLPLGLINRLGVAVGETLEQASPRDWKWRGRSVKLMDGTTVSMPDTPANQSVYPQSGGQQPGLGFPLALLVGLISLSTGAVLRWALGPCRGKHTGEQALFRTLLPYLEAADVVLADRYHCNYFTVALLVERGVDLVTRQHQRRITDFRRGQRLGPRDRLVQWQRPQRPSWMDVQTYARMPESLTLRQAEVAGRILVTTLTDARTVSVQEVDALYRRRWQVEVDLRSIKAEMGMAVVRAQSPAMVDKEIGVYLLAYNSGVCPDDARRRRGPGLGPGAELQGNAAIAARISTASASERGPERYDHDGASARGNQPARAADTSGPSRAARHQTKTEKPSPAHGSASRRPRGNPRRPSSAGLR